VARTQATSTVYSPRRPWKWRQLTHSS